MKLYFARHGESEANRLHVISNQGDRYGLTPTGQQAGGGFQQWADDQVLMA